jgi:hypothetical protein
MTRRDFKLAAPPNDQRAREVWLQHAAAFEIFERVRGYAIDRLAPDMPEDTRSAATHAIDDAVFGLMEVIDGFPAPFRNDAYEFSLHVVARLTDRDEPRNTVAELDLRDGDGMAIGFSGWLEGDFGKDPVVAT